MSKLLIVLLCLWITLFAVATRAWGYDPKDLAPTNVCHVGGKTEMLCLHNWTRKQHGLPALKPLPSLYVAAGKKADDVERCQVFSHDPCGYGVWSYFPTPTGAYYWGENLVYGWGKARVDYAAWLDSPEHFANIINPNYKWYGSAFRTSPFPYLWAVDFGG